MVIYTMNIFRSISLAVLIAAIVLGFSISVIAPELPRVVGHPDVVEVRNLPVHKASSLILHNSRGGVEINTVNGEDISIIAHIEAYAVDSDVSKLRQYISEIIELDQEGGTLTVVTEPEERPDDVELSVKYEIKAPAGTNIQIINGNGEITIAEGFGQLDIRCNNGGIQIKAPVGPVTAETTNGRIRLWDAPENARLKTINGNIYAHMIGAGLDAETTNGAIVARLLEPEVLTCDLTSRNGGITVVFSEDCSATVEAHTSDGIVKSDLPIDTIGGEKKLRQLKGTIGEGRTIVSAKTLNGNIWFTRSRS